MIHYHGVPINPESAGVAALTGGHAFVSFSDPRNIALVNEVCQSFAVDNGAFSSWRAGTPVTDWSEYYTWARMCHRMPGCDFAVIPDVIDGTEAENDALLMEWPLPDWFGAPVWHMHEGLDRLDRLAHEFPRVCIGSSGDYAHIGTRAWWQRMADAMDAICRKDGTPVCRLHGLRMLDPSVFSRLPFASADSTNIARNVGGLDGRWDGPYSPPTKEARAVLLRARIEAFNAAPRWRNQLPEQADQGGLF